MPYCFGRMTNDRPTPRWRSRCDHRCGPREAAFAGGKRIAVAPFVTTTVIAWRRHLGSRPPSSPAGSRNGSVLAPRRQPRNRCRFGMVTGLAGRVQSSVRSVEAVGDCPCGEGGRPVVQGGQGFAQPGGLAPGLVTLRGHPRGGGEVAGQPGVRVELRPALANGRRRLRVALHPALRERDGRRAVRERAPSWANFSRKVSSSLGVDRESGYRPRNTGTRYAPARTLSVNPDIESPSCNSRASDRTVQPSATRSSRSFRNSLRSRPEPGTALLGCRSEKNTLFGP